MQKLTIVADIPSPHRHERGQSIRVLKDENEFLLETEIAEKRQRRVAVLNRPERMALLEALQLASDLKGMRRVPLTGGQIQLTPTNRGEPFMEGLELALLLPDDEWADDSIFLAEREIADLIRALKSA